MEAAAAGGRAGSAPRPPATISVARARRDRLGSAAAKSACVYGLQRLAGERLGVAPLHDLAQVHHRDRVAHVRDRGQVVRDEEVGHPQPLPAGRAAGSGSGRGSTHRARRPARPARSAAATARAPARCAMRCRWPPENSCGKRSAARAGRPTRSSSSQHALRTSARPAASLITSGSATIVPHAHARVERAVRDPGRPPAPPGDSGAQLRADRARARPRPRSGSLPPSAAPAAAPACDVVVLPQPDSPTSPSVSPRSRVNETPSTARTVPRLRPSSPRRTGKCLVSASHLEERAHAGVSAPGSADSGASVEPAARTCPASTTDSGGASAAAALHHGGSAGRRRSPRPAAPGRAAGPRWR